MRIIAFDLNRPTIDATDKQVVDPTSPFVIRCPTVRLTRYPTFWPNYKRRNLFLRIATADRTSECQRGTHQLDPAPSRNPLRKFRSGHRKLALNIAAKLGTLAQFAQAPPVASLRRLGFVLAHR